MGDEQKNRFEQQLKEILDSGPTCSENDQKPEEHKEGNEIASPTKPSAGTKIDVGVILRIIAILTVLVLLLSFGVQIAYK